MNLMVVNHMCAPFGAKIISNLAVW